MDFLTDRMEIELNGIKFFVLMLSILIAIIFLIMAGGLANILSAIALVVSGAGLLYSID